MLSMIFFSTFKFCTELVLWRYNFEIIPTLFALRDIPFEMGVGSPNMLKCRTEKLRSWKSTENDKLLSLNKYRWFCRFFSCNNLKTQFQWKSSELSHKLVNYMLCYLFMLSNFHFGWCLWQITENHLLQWWWKTMKYTPNKGGWEQSEPSVKIRLKSQCPRKRQP